MISVTAQELKQQWLPTVAQSSRSMRSAIKDRKAEAREHAMEGEEEGLKISQATAQLMTATVGKLSEAIELLQDMDDDLVLVTLDRVGLWSRVRCGGLASEKEEQAYYILKPDNTRFRVRWSDSQLEDGSFGCIREIHNDYVPKDVRGRPEAKQVYEAAIVIGLWKHKNVIDNE